MKRITNKAEFVELAKELGVRSDWHEPDEQEVTAHVWGTSFDNAGTWPHDESGIDPVAVEKYVMIYQHGEAVAVVNLATLCAWASGLEH
jgi:hypothetical protein